MTFLVYSIIRTFTKHYGRILCLISYGLYGQTQTEIRKFIILQRLLKTSSLTYCTTCSTFLGLRREVEGGHRTVSQREKTTVNEHYS